MPPRPPLGILVPSILLGLVWTACKILVKWWWGDVTDERERGRETARSEDEDE